jgi:hypothetical protein
MISRAIVQSAIVLMNRRMNAERDVRMFVPVCSSVAGMHSIISKERIWRKRYVAPKGTTPRTAAEFYRRHTTAVLCQCVAFLTTRLTSDWILIPA